MREEYKGQISLAEYFASKAFWFNNEGVHIASGIPGQEINTSDVTTYAHNILITDQGFYIRYMDQTLSKWDKTSIVFYYNKDDGSIDRAAELGREGLSLLNGKISLGDNFFNKDINAEAEDPYALLEEANGIYIDRDRFFVGDKTLETYLYMYRTINQNDTGEEVVGSSMNFISNNFKILSPENTPSGDPELYLIGNIFVNGTLKSDNIQLSLQNDETKAPGFYIDDTDLNTALFVIQDNIPTCNNLDIKKQVLFGNLGFILRDNGHLALKRI